MVKPARSAEIGGEVFTVTLDLGGIAKGLAAARAAEILRLHKIGEGYVSVGRSSLYILTPQGMDVAATDPLKPETQYICFKKCRGSVATSGSYENRYRSGGIEYSHIIDGKTGMPIPYGALTASVIGGDAATADALATDLCAMESKDALELMASPDFPKAALLRDNGGTVKLYTNMEEAEYELFNGAEVCFIPRKS